MVAIVAVGAGFLSVLGAGAAGAAAKSVGIGFLAMGAIAWFLGAHEPERGQACSLFFIPLRAYAAVSLIAGGVFLFIPSTAPTSTPKNPKLDGIETRLRSETASGSSGWAAEKAASYQKAIVAFEKIAGMDGKVNVHLDVEGTDFKEAPKAALYVQSTSLKKYGDDGKKSLISICLKMMRADFPKATCQAAARGPFLWGVQGWSTAAPDAAPVIKVTSDSPGF